MIASSSQLASRTSLSSLSTVPKSPQFAARSSIHQRLIYESAQDHSIVLAPVPLLRHVTGASFSFGSIQKDVAAEPAQENSPTEFAAVRKLLRAVQIVGCGRDELLGGQSTIA
jgi:hypothetical protein